MFYLCLFALVYILKHASLFESSWCLAFEAVIACRSEIDELYLAAREQNALLTQSDARSVRNATLDPRATFSSLIQHHNYCHVRVGLFTCSLFRGNS